MNLNPDGCTYSTLSSGTSLYRPYKGVPFPLEIRRRRIRETLESVSTFSSVELLHAVMSRSGLQGTPEIDIKLAVGQYEFSIGRKLMFAADGTMLHGSLNNTLMDILEKLDTGRNIEGYTKEDLHDISYRDNSLRRRSEFNGRECECSLLKNWTWIKTCSYLADHFTILFSRAHI